MVVYLSEIFNSLNSLKQILQGTNSNIFHIKNNVKAMLIKLDLWKNCSF